MIVSSECQTRRLTSVHNCTGERTADCNTHVMKLENTEWKESDEAVAAFEEQALPVGDQNRQNNTRHVADGGVYSGYVVTGDELVELHRTNKLNIRGIESLG